MPLLILIALIAFACIFPAIGEKLLVVGMIILLFTNPGVFLVAIMILMLGAYLFH